MATLISRANGNLTGSTAFAAIATGSGASVTGTAAGTLSTNTSQTSATFTITNGEVVDGVMLKLDRQGTSGTFTVALYKNNVLQQSVVVNHGDLPSDTSWIFFKFAGTVTGAGTADYDVRISNQPGASSLLVYTSGTLAGFQRFLRTTTTATPNAADDLYIVGELTQAAALTFTADTSPGSAVMTNVSSFTGLSVGQTVYSSDDGVARTISALDPGASTVTTSTTWNNIRTGATFYIGAVQTDITVTMDQLASNTSVYQRVFTGDTTSGSQGVANVSSMSGLALGNPVSGPSIASANFNFIFGLPGGSNLQLFATGGVTTATGATITAQTGYGAIHIGKRGILSFAATAATNFLLRMFGDLNVWGDGTLNIGTVGTPCPRDSTMVLEFGPATDGGYGLIANDGATVTMQGLSRTSGKNVVSCKAVGGFFTGNITSGNNVITGVSDFTDVANGQFISRIVTGGITPGTTISSFDTGAQTITMSANAIGTSSGATLLTGSAIGATTLPVDTDTGWLSGDLIAIASTNRTASDCEAGKLTADAGASSLAANGWVAAATGQVLPLTGSGGLLAPHNGNSPVQAEIINLTRNVKVRSISPTLMTYVFLGALCTADIDWVEFYYMGENTANKRGIEIPAGTTANPKNIQYCSIHDCEDYGLYNVGGTQFNLVFSNNVMWNCASVTGPAINLNAITNNDWTISGNIIIRTLNGTGATLADIGGTFTNNVVAGAASTGISLTETSAVFGTFSGNVTHSGGASGVATGTGQSGTISDTTVWRNNSSGLNLSNMLGAHFDGVVAFGNNSQNISLPASGEITFTDAVLNGDSSFSTGGAVTSSNTGGSGTFTFNDCSFGVASGILTAHTAADINPTGLQSPKMFFNNCLFGSATEVATPYYLSPRAIVASSNHDQTSGNHKFWKKGGTGQSDATIYKTAAPSERLTPASTIVTAGAVPSFTGAFTNGGTVVSSVSDFRPLAVGQFIVSSGFSVLGIITALDSGAGTITVDRPHTGTSGGSTLYIQPKLESSSRLVTVDSGGTRSVSVWVRKQQENLMSYSDFSTNWGLTFATTTTGQTDWDGGTTATKFLETANAGTSHGVTRSTSVTITSGATYTASFYVKGGLGRQWIRFVEDTRASWFDITSGVVGTANAAHTLSITSIGSGWYRCSVTFVAGDTTHNPAIWTATADNDSAAFLGDITKGFLAGGYQLERAATAGVYQATTSDTYTGYNGSQPRLVCKANPALGVDVDTVLDTMTVAWGNWEVLTGNTPTAVGDHGAFELVVDADGTTGWVNVDDWQVAA
jgi:hypothetical protein